MSANDTNPKIEKMMLDRYRGMSAAEKLAIVDGLTTMVQQLALADIRRRHPNADDREQKLRLASRWLAPDVMRRLFGWDPDVMGY